MDIEGKAWLRIISTKRGPRAKWTDLATLLVAQHFRKLLDRKHAPNLVILKSDHTGCFYAKQYYYIVTLRDKNLCN